MIRQPPKSKPTDTLFPYTTLFRSVAKFQKHITSGQLALIVQGRPITDMMDRRLPTRDIITPTSTHNRLARIVEREPWKDMVDMALLETMWNAAIEAARSEEHTSELQSLMRISYAVFCLKKKK